MAIVNCPECNEKVSDEAKICPHCGVSLNHCKECGSIVPPNVKTCPCCGAPMQEILRRTTANTKSVYQVKDDGNNSKDFIHRNKVAIITVVAFITVGAVVGFIMKHGQTESDKNVTSDTLDTTMVDTVSYDTFESEPITFVGDGATFDVMGRVKEISNEEGKTLWKFSTDMKFIPSHEMEKVRRNSNDQIEIYLCEEGGGFNYKYEYNSLGRILREHDNRDISKYLYHEDLELLETEDIILDYKYDADNYVNAIDVTIKYNQGDYIVFSNPKTFKTHLDVKVLEKDSKGNWTKRRIQGEVVTLSSEGIDEAGENDEGTMYYCKKKVDYTEERYIDYYEE